MWVEFQTYGLRISLPKYQGSLICAQSVQESNKNILFMFFLPYLRTEHFGVEANLAQEQMLSCLKLL